MKYEKELKILEILYFKTKNEKNNKKKSLLLNDYFSLAYYLNSVGVIELDDYIKKLDSGLYVSKMTKAHLKLCNSFASNFGIIENLIDELLIVYEKNPIKTRNFVYFNPINIKLGLKIIEDFFGNLGNEFYHTWEDLIADDRITFLTSTTIEGATFNVSDDYGQFIIIRKTPDGFDYDNLSCIVHEVGHCYDIKLNQKRRLELPLNLLVEISSLFLQKLFDFYNIDNNLYKKEALNCRMMWQMALYDRTLTNKFINDCLQSDCLKEINHSTLDIEPFDLLTPPLSAKEQKLIQNTPPNIDNYAYVICDHLANNLVKIYKENPKECLQLLKRIILTYSKGSFRKIIHKYGKDFSETEKIISEVSSYQRELKL